MSEKISDAELVAKASAGDKESYRVLVEKYQQRVFAIAFDVVRSREDAEDIAQESFVKAYLSLPEFKGESSFYTWLYRIAYNMAIDFRRRTVRRGGAPVEFDETRADVVAEASGSVQNRFGSPQELMLRKEESQQIQKVLTEISPEHRAVITLREIEGLSYEEIADVVGVSKGTVMSRLHYARKHLQQGLQALGMRGSGKQALPEELANIEQTTVSVKTT
ncbi:MAG: sigma-70 family RNA polymerase sigma factor [Deltaproteobacteria bacterium]|nr:sigma-70 family RNA polymerase sigma factor [Deltaproteobacteria bacterium]